MKCKQCPTDFKQYSTLETLCPKCRVDKLKKDDNESIPIRNRKFPKRKSQDMAGIVGPRNASRTTISKVVEGGNERRKKSQKNAITNRSKTQKKKDSVIASLKAERIKKHGPYCEHCGDGEPLHYSHLIPKSVRPDLYLDPNNGCNACPACHDSWEHLQDIERVRKFFNLQTILSYLQRVDTKRYNRVIEKINQK